MHEEEDRQRPEEGPQTIAPGVQDRVDAMLAEVQRELPGPWTFTDFCEWLARRRGKPLEFVAMPANQKTDSVHGWVAMGDDIDEIHHPASLDSPRGRQTAYHEFAHLLFEHKSTDEDHMDLREVIAPDVGRALAERALGRTDPASNTNALGRTDYDRPQEQEAELLGQALRRNDVEYLGIRSADPKVAARVGRARRMLRGN